MRRLCQLPSTVLGNLGKPTQLELWGQDSGRGNTRDLGKHVWLGKHPKARETLAIWENTSGWEKHSKAGETLTSWGNTSGWGNTGDLGKHFGLGKHSKARETLDLGNTHDLGKHSKPGEIQKHARLGGLRQSGEDRRVVLIPKLGKPLPKFGETP